MPAFGSGNPAGSLKWPITSVVQRFPESLNDTKCLVCRASEPENRLHFSWKRSK